MDAMDKAVVPALSTLVAQYGLQNKPVDPFFRGLGRLLVDIAAAEFQWLQAVMGAVRSGPHDAVVDISAKPPISFRTMFGWQLLVWLDDQRWRRMFSLLKSNGLGQEVENLPLKAGDMHATSETLRLDKDIVIRICEIIGEPAEHPQA